MKASLTWIGKALAVWLALLAGNVIGGLLIGMPVMEIPQDGPLTLGVAFPLTNALFALVLAALASRMPGPAWRRIAILFLILFTTETLLSVIESVFFADYLHLPAGLLASMTGIGAVKAVLGALAAGLLWRPDGPTPPVPTGLAWKIPAIVASYVVVYFGAGHLIAWQSATLRAYYGDGLAFNDAGLVLLQIGRGLIWAGLVLLAACSLHGSTRARAVLTGAAFSIFMASSLLYPNGFMPWAVRSVHLVEIATSNFLFGVVAILILASRRGLDRKNRGDAATTAA